jgi:hypothetical protein
MDRQHAVAGIGGQVRVGGRDYRLRPLTLGDLAELKAYLASRRMSPIAALGRELKDVDPRQQAELMRTAMREAREGRGVTADELEAYLESFAGAAHLFWMMARDDCPSLDSLAAAKACLIEYADDRMIELQSRLDQATGFLSDVAPLGNYSGQARAMMTTARSGQTFIAA